jgi:geranylgeranyl reductase family protein
MKVDVAVVGAGPAGATTALLLARAGWQVLLLERERLPRYKVCGGGVTRKALVALPCDVGDVLECAPTRARVTVRGTSPVEIDTGAVAAWTTMRDRFDSRIVAEALRAGAQLRDGCAVHGIADNQLFSAGETVTARVIVAADGAPSRLAAALGLPSGRRQTPAIEAEVSVAPEVLAAWQTTVLFDFAAAPGGYGWVFPKADHLSIGLCSLHQKVSGLRERALGYVATLLGEGSYQVTRLRGHLLAVGGPAGPAHRGSALLVGDAAGLADPFLGEGIAYAVQSAGLAAQTIDRFLRGEIGDLSPYSRALQQQFQREFRWADRLGRIVYRYPRATQVIAMRNRYVAQVFLGILCGEQDYASLAPALLRHPLALLGGYRSAGPLRPASSGRSFDAPAARS